MSETPEARLRRLAEAATPGPYHVAPDYSPNHADHQDSGLAMIETGRTGMSEWPPAMLMEWPQAHYFAALDPARIQAAMAVIAAARALSDAENAQPYLPEDDDDLVALRGTLAAWDALEDTTDA